MEEYNGDIVKIERLKEFVQSEYWEWDDSGEITLDDISIAIHEALPEVLEFYGDTWEYPVIQHRDRDWHIGRIIYFINHPEEIKDIKIDNETVNNCILPLPIIIDGWHRYAAAMWLYDQEKISDILCKYGGRLDILKYLKAEVDDFLEEM